MTDLLKKKWFIPAVVVAGIATISVLVWAFFQDTYMSIKEMRANPPFEGVYWGMTIPEFCEAMDIEESDLIPTEPLTYDDIHGRGRLELFEREYDVSAEDMPLYEYYENHFDIQLSRELLGAENYYLGDKPQTIHVVFTDETTWNGKNIPPLLCYIIFQAPAELEWAISNELSLYYDGKELDPGIAGIGIGGGLLGPTVHYPAYILSQMYSCGMSVEEIAAYPITASTSRDEILELNIECPVYTSVRPNNPCIEIHRKVEAMTMDLENITIVMDGGYTAYYEWFLTVLT